MKGREFPLPEEPTQAPPGSVEKIEELARRLVQGQSLFHPNDARGVRRVGRGLTTPIPEVSQEEEGWEVWFKNGKRFACARLVAGHYGAVRV